MEKIVGIDAITVRYAFNIGVLKYPKANEYLARINGHSPSMFQQGDRSQYMRFRDEEVLRDEDKDRLVARCRARIEEVDGEILLWIDHSKKN